VTVLAQFTGEKRRDIVVVTISLTIAALIHGLTMPLLSLVLDQQGISSTMIGISTAVQYLSVFAIAPFAPKLMRTIGPAWMMLWAIIAMTFVLLLFPLMVDVWVWMPLRLVLGITSAMLWIAGEAWVNHTTEEKVRGRVIAIYTMVTAAGFAIGPLIITVTGSVGWAPFIASASIIILAAIPLAWVLGDAPRLSGGSNAPLTKYLRLAPVGLIVYLTFSMTDGILLTFLPLYGKQAGLSESDAILLLTIMAIGVIVFQWPVGWLADHMDRMLLTAVALVLMFVLSCGMPYVIAHSPWNGIYALVFGGVFGVLYTMPMVMLGHRFKGADLAAAATVFGVMFSVGSVIGPPIGGVAMAYLGEHGLAISLAVIYLVFLPLPIYGYIRKHLV